MKLVKDHMFLSIHMEGVWLVPLIKFYMKSLFGLDPDMFYPSSYKNQYFLTLYIMVQNLMTNIYNILTEKDIHDDGSGIFPKQKVRNIYNAKYHATYANPNFVLKRYYIKDTRIHWVYLGRK